jgi:uncharacterized protein YbaA (DUF1428 family)
MAENGAAMEYGCIETVESWGITSPAANTPASAARRSCSTGWQVWPDKATLDAAEVTMHQDKRLEALGEIPFDPKRLILGCSAPISMMAALDAP